MHTHDVENQSPPLSGFDALACDPALTSAIAREGAEGALPFLADLARLVTSAKAREHAVLANANPPVLHTHDRYGHRIDEVEFHPSWHWLMGNAVGWGLHGAPWGQEPGTGAHVARAAGFYLASQLEAGHGCPISMSYAAVPALRHDPELAALYEPGLLSHSYEFGLAEPGGKAGLLAGMSMTEKQGGSDVRAISSTATPTAEGTYRIVGHKWFTSAPMNDLFLTLAQAPGGLTCFVLPRVLPDGTRNGIRLQRLKDKLGNRSNASAEIEYADATGWRLGEEGRGVRTIIDMVSMTRLDCVLGSSALIRAALSEATHHIAHRHAFGSLLADKPLMQTVVADMALESEASTALGMRLAGAVDRGEHDLLRLALPASKYLVCKRTPTLVAEALECLGGNGYIEDSGLPRLYREAPLNSVWEGSGNVTALDVLRALNHDAAPVEAVLAEVEAAKGLDRWFDRGIQDLHAELRGREERRARRLAEMVALCLQGSLLLRHAPSEVGSGFIASRFSPEGPWRTIGTLPAEAHTVALLERVTPHVG
ncbi:acyl-CoA dehydrogenase family protein [Pseudonocardia humida]|uniref:Acyl-CoA dehydrogenase family protein n=1 Tax=Pseudonocardia humida TaxID=2800819 RepID=A0ABT1ABI5_9PSEU|nr:acyl-CoA dehydrogenase family protein [Pseudonocardia humida]MCO1660004.1 acyl-CoA dehydrogenase family protein [Pseudonocardia humida]